MADLAGHNYHERSGGASKQGCDTVPISQMVTILVFNFSLGLSRNKSSTAYIVGIPTLILKLYSLYEIETLLRIQ